MPLDHKALLKTGRKYLNPQAMGDLDTFLEALPANAGKTGLIVAGIIWVTAAGLGLFTIMQMHKLTELRTSVLEAEALVPIVPKIQDTAVNSNEIKNFVEKTSVLYKDVVMKANGSNIQIEANSTAFFGAFRDAIGHVQTGGKNWKVSVEKLCVGRECEKSPLAVILKVNKVSVTEPDKS